MAGGISQRRKFGQIGMSALFNVYIAELLYEYFPLEVIFPDTNICRIKEERK